MMKRVYLILTVLGLVFPYALLIPWLVEYGLDFRLFFHELFVNGIAGAFGIDVILSAVVLIFFIFIEGKRNAMQNLWMPVVGTLLVGVSFALPLFLYMREKH